MPDKTQTNKKKLLHLYIFSLSNYIITLFCCTILILYAIKCTKYNLEYITLENSLDLFSIGIGLSLVFEIIVNKHLFNYRGSSIDIATVIAYLKYIHYQDYKRNNAYNFLPIYHSSIICIIIFKIFYSAMGNASFIVFSGFAISYFINYSITYTHVKTEKRSYYCTKTGAYIKNYP